VSDNAYGWLRPWINKLCNAEPDFAVYLSEEDELTHHYLAIVNRAMVHAGSHYPAREIAVLLRTRSRKQVLRLCGSAIREGC